MPLTQRQHRRSQDHSQLSRVVSGCAGVALLLFATSAPADNRSANNQEVDSQDNVHAFSTLDKSLAANQHTGAHRGDFSPLQYTPSRLHYSTVYQPTIQQRTSDTHAIVARPQNTEETINKQSFENHPPTESETHSGGAALGVVLRDSLQHWWKNYTSGHSLRWLTAEPQTVKQDNISDDTAQWDYSLKLSDDKVGVKFEKAL